MKKLDFTHEGTMRECEIKNGKFISLDIYAKIKNHWAGNFAQQTILSDENWNRK